MRKKAFGLVLAICCLFLFGMRLLANPTTLSNATKFELVNGLVVVEAELEGCVANFILDTGSPVMILNERNLVQSSFKAKNLQGPLTGSWRKIEEFALAGVRKFGLQALTTDISALETVTGRPIAGLIGYDFLVDIELLLDFREMKLTLVSGETAKVKDTWQQKVELPFTMAGHLPVIEAKIGGLDLRLGLDTGANINLLNVNFAQKLDASLMETSVGANIIGMDGNSLKTTATEIPTMEIGGFVFKKMQFVFTDIAGLENLMNNRVDGLLGFPLFQGCRVSLNYSKLTLSIWK